MSLFLICHCYIKLHPDLSLFLLHLNSFSKNNGYFWKRMLQQTKRLLKLFPGAIFALCVIFRMQKYCMFRKTFRPKVAFWPNSKEFRKFQALHSCKIYSYVKQEQQQQKYKIKKQYCKIINGLPYPWFFPKDFKLIIYYKR